MGGVSGTTSYLCAFFVVSFLVISNFLGVNLKFFGAWVSSLTTPSNLYFLSFRVRFNFLGGFLLTLIEVVGKLIRCISLTCRLGANISARHLLSAIFFYFLPEGCLLSVFWDLFFVFEVRI